MFINVLKRKQKLDSLVTKLIIKHIAYSNYKCNNISKTDYNVLIFIHSTK
jgi:hypothetical protein